MRHDQITVNDSSLHVVEAGDPGGVPFVFLHGWPESWRSWQDVMELAAPDVRAIAVDLPGIGGSTGAATDGSKRQIAEVVHGLISAMSLRDSTLVGADIGGMVVYAYLRAYQDLRRAVIMDVAIPGLDPWEEILRNPYIWHFAFHATPRLPERLVQDRQADYFAVFYDQIAAKPERVTPEARAAYAEAYATDSALTAGFDWYRAFTQDADDNKRTRGPVSTPLLYMRGEHEWGDIKTYVDGFRAAGITDIEHALIPGAGHFAQEEAPDEVWRLISPR